MQVNSQQLRIVIGGIIAVTSLIGIIALSFTGHAVPEPLAGASVASLAYTFGVTTNGSGLGGGTPAAKAP